LEEVSAINSLGTNMCLEKSNIFRTEKFVVRSVPDKEDVRDV